MIDVLLVLLVIFMAALPLSHRGLDVTLPADAAASAEAPDRQIVVEYSADRRLAINKQPIDLTMVEGRLREIYANRRDRCGCQTAVPLTDVHLREWHVGMLWREPRARA